MLANGHRDTDVVKEEVTQAPGISTGAIAAHTLTCETITIFI